MKKNEIANRVKELILMPPPKPLTRTKSETSDDLRRNLMENTVYIQDNSILQEELNKIISLNKENNSSILSNRDETSSYYFNEGNLRFNFSKDNYTLLSDDESNINDFNRNNKEKLKYNLIKQDNNNYINDFKKYTKFPKPKCKKEITIFVNNIIGYINYLIEFYSNSSIKDKEKEISDLDIIKIRIETRYNDYRNKGLKEDYFISCLSKEQEDFINKISSINNSKLEDIIIVENYKYLSHKRKRTKSLSEMKSITSDSNSFSI